MNITDSKYSGHPIFSLLQKCSKFYDTLSFSIMGFGTQGTMAPLNIDTYVFSSMKGTIESINDILIKGRINDAYALLRKYYDSIIINIYSNLYLDDNFSIDNLIVDKINDWLQGKSQLPQFRIMSSYVRSSKKLEEINKILYMDSKYKDIRNRCNNHTHYNFYHNVLLNDNEIYLKNRITTLNRLSKDVEDLFILHLSYLFTLNEHYMMSSDYVDCLEVGMTPEKGSQYYVAPFIQDIFDEVIKKKRVDIATEIKNKTCMKLE